MGDGAMADGRAQFVLSAIGQATRSSPSGTKDQMDVYSSNACTAAIVLGSLAIWSGQPEVRDDGVA
jgi:hypothetical protein